MAENVIPNWAENRFDCGSFECTIGLKSNLDDKLLNWFYPRFWMDHNWDILCKLDLVVSLFFVNVRNLISWLVLKMIMVVEMWQRISIKTTLWKMAMDLCKIEMHPTVCSNNWAILQLSAKKGAHNIFLCCSIYSHCPILCVLLDSEFTGSN